jgi:hypothetical protein
MGSNSDARVFLGLTTYFIILTFILGLSPYNNGANFIIAPTDVTSGNGNSTAGSGFSLATKVSTGILCAGTIAVATVVGLVTGGLGFLGYASLGASCGGFILTLTAPSNVADSINVLLHNVFVFMFVFFELLTFQLDIPLLMNVLLVVPAAGTMMYLGIRILRGGG